MTVKLIYIPFYHQWLYHPIGGFHKIKIVFNCEFPASLPLIRIIITHKTFLYLLNEYMIKTISQPIYQKYVERVNLKSFQGGMGFYTMAHLSKNEIMI